MGKYVIYAHFSGDEESTQARTKSPLLLTGLNEGLNIQLQPIQTINYNTTNIITGTVKTRLNNTIPNKTVHIHIIQPNNDEIILDTTTNNNGTFTTTFNASQRGEYTIYAITDADELYSKSSSTEIRALTNTLNVTLDLTCDEDTQIVDNTVNLKCNITDSTDTPVNGLTVRFYNNDTLLGSSVTNSNGIATLKPVLTNVGNNNIHCSTTANTKYNSGESNTIQITTVKHTINVALDSSTIYKGWNGKLRATNEKGEGTNGITFTVRVNGTTNTIVSDTAGYINLSSFESTGTFNIQVTSDATTKYAAFSQSYTLTVKDTISVNNTPLLASNVETSIPYKTWTYLENMKVDNDELYAMCGQRCYTDTLAGRNGSRNTPSTLKFSNLQFNIPNGATIDSMKIYMKIRTLSCSSDTANIGISAPTLRIFNQTQLFQLPTSNGRLPYKTFGTITANVDVTNIPVSTINNNNTSFTVSFPRNSTTNPGRLQIDYVYVTVKYTPRQEA